MARALTILAGGVLLAFAAMVLLTPGVVAAPDGFAYVLLTMVAGGAVMAVAVRRRLLREREQELAQHTTDTVTDPTTQEPDRG